MKVSNNRQESTYKFAPRIAKYVSTSLTLKFYKRIEVNRLLLLGGKYISVKLKLYDFSSRPSGEREIEDKKETGEK